MVQVLAGAKERNIGKLKVHSQVLLGGAMTLALTLTSCGNAVNTEIYGRSGWAASPGGETILRVQPCGLPVNEIRVTGLAREINGQKVPPLYFHYVANEPVTKYFEVSFEAPPEGWQVVEGSGLPGDPAELLIVNVLAADGIDAQIGQTQATGDAIAQLEPGEVVQGSSPEEEGYVGKVLPESEFMSCEHRSYSP